MKRPTRIVVFGVFCLIIGVVSGVKNTMEAGLAFIGPDGLEMMLEMAKEQPPGLPETSEQSLTVEIKAQRNPPYRIGQAVESTGSAFMAMLLLVGGYGLLRDKRWSLKLARWWAIYAIPAAAVTVALSTRYALPEVPNAPSNGTFNAILMLLAMWAFPVLLLRQLPTEAVKNYLAHQETQRDGSPVAPAASPAPSDQPPLGTQDRSASPPDPLSPPSTGSTWRDDPWNDPGAR
ncbi:MAG: hypothetical protein AAGB26_14545 [Planctomycetota bacterium]